MQWLAIDIGGANLKAADGNGKAWLTPFALWKSPADLPGQLRRLVASADEFDRLAVTMTGELADCFRDKSEGARFILNAACSAALAERILVYGTRGEFIPVAEAAQRPLDVAASNWHALARFAGRFSRAEPAMLIDIGSTTCDVIPLIGGLPAARGRNDTDRLVAGELCYTGVERSPICAVIREVPYRGSACPVAQELFATMQDVWILLGKLPERPDDTNTADGQPATKAASEGRLARVICADSSQFNRDDAILVAAAAADAQLDQIVTSARRVIETMPERPLCIIVSGHGEFLGDMVCRKLFDGVPVTSLSEQLGAEATRCATAHALAVIARESFHE